MNPEEQRLQTIKLANRVINGSRSLSLLNEIFLYFIMGEINPNAENPLQIKTTKRRYAEYRGLASKDFKRISGELRKVFKNFNNNPLIIEDEKSGRLLQRNWLSLLDLDGDDIYISVSPEVGSFLLYKKGQLYTKVLYDITHFRSVHTIGIKEIIEAELFKKQAHFDKSLTFLRFKLGIENKYSSLRDFKRFVLDIAKRELSTINFPIQFDYSILNANGKVLKKGQRGGQAVRFYVIDKRDEIRALFESPKDLKSLEDGSVSILTNKQKSFYKIEEKAYSREYEQLNLWGIDDETIENILAQYGIEEIQSSIILVKNTPNVKSPSGLFLRSLKEGWQSAPQIQVGKNIDKRRRSRLEKQKQAEKERLEKAEMDAFTEAHKKICDKQLKLKKDKGLDHYYEAAKKYVAPIMMKFYLKYSPKETYREGVFAMYLRYCIEQTYPKAFEKLYEMYPDFKKELEVLNPDSQHLG